MNWELFFIILGIVLGAFILTYIVAIFASGPSILRSRILKTKNNKGDKADHYYYLPGASLTIQATALVEVKKEVATNIILKTSLVQLAFEPQASIVPDTSQLIALDYRSQWFFNEEVKMTTTSTSLLENISTVSEDRIGSIVSQFTNAGKAAIVEQRYEAKPEAESTGVETITETIEFKRQFIIPGDDLMKGEIQVAWQIVVKGIYESFPTPIDAGFSLNTPNPLAPINLQSNKFMGILTRPLVKQNWKITPNDELEPVPFTCIVPDPSYLIVVPVRRSFFVKRSQMPKLTNGILVENYINKPSEAEGLASIPINILKAIFSIPAQLLQFRIIRNKQEVEYDKSVVESITARQARQEAEAKKKVKELMEDIQELKEKVGQTEAKKTPQKQTQELKEKELVPELGKLPALKPEEMLDEEAGHEVMEVKTETRPVPPSHFWHEKSPLPWMDYQNTINGKLNCIPVSSAHIITMWTSFAKESALVLLQNSVDEAFEREGVKDPQTGKLLGCVLSSYLKGWKEKGVGGHTILDYAKLTTGKIQQLKQCIFQFGGCIVGFRMPATAKAQLNKWEVIEGTPSSAPGSWGGHAVAAIGYGNDSFMIISWGRMIEVTWEFYEKYSDESYTMLSTDWLDKDNKSPSGFDPTELKSLLRAVKLS